MKTLDEMMLDNMVRDFTSVDKRFAKSDVRSRIISYAREVVKASVPEEDVFPDEPFSVRHGMKVGRNACRSETLARAESILGKEKV